MDKVYVEDELIVFKAIRFFRGIAKRLSLFCVNGDPLAYISRGFPIPSGICSGE
jgi:hypothetical protein